jgi:hypothetical protein
MSGGDLFRFVIEHISDHVSDHVSEHVREHVRKRASIVVLILQHAVC